MYSENIRQNNQNGWLHTDKQDVQSNINETDRLPTTANTTLLTNDDKVEIINESNQNSVSQPVDLVCEIHAYLNHFLWNIFDA